MKKLSDSHSSFLAGSLLITRRSEGVDRTTLSKARKNNEAYVRLRIGINPPSGIYKELSLMPGRKQE